jgi:hypothetical protein
MRKDLFLVASLPLCSTADLLKTEEAARQLDTDLASMTRRLQQLEAGIRARDKEVERHQRMVEQAWAEVRVREGEATPAAAAPSLALLLRSLSPSFSPTPPPLSQLPPPPLPPI